MVTAPSAAPLRINGGAAAARPSPIVLHGSFSTRRNIIQVAMTTLTSEIH
jgi:hypothetical protein